MISTILMISKEIVTRSYSLLKAYISMDMQVRVIEEQIKNDSLEPKEKKSSSIRKTSSKNHTNSNNRDLKTSLTATISSAQGS